MKGQPRSGKAEDRRYFKEVRFRQIRALFEISRQGSFAAAARSLGMATPSVWRQVRALEDDYGVRFVTAKDRATVMSAGGVLQVAVEAQMGDQVRVGGYRREQQGGEECEGRFHVHGAPSLTDEFAISPRVGGGFFLRGEHVIFA